MKRQIRTRTRSQLSQHKHKDIYNVDVSEPELPYKNEILNMDEALLTCYQWYWHINNHRVLHRNALQKETSFEQMKVQYMTCKEMELKLKYYTM